MDQLLLIMKNKSNVHTQELLTREIRGFKTIIVFSSSK
jgi:hypothetical protein